MNTKKRLKYRTYKVIQNNLYWRFGNLIQKVFHRNSIRKYRESSLNCPSTLKNVQDTKLKNLDFQSLRNKIKDLDIQPNVIIGTKEAIELRLGYEIEVLDEEPTEKGKLV